MLRLSLVAAATSSLSWRSVRPSLAIGGPFVVDSMTRAPHCGHRGVPRRTEVRHCLHWTRPDRFSASGLLRGEALLRGGDLARPRRSRICRSRPATAIPRSAIPGNPAASALYSDRAQAWSQMGARQGPLASIGSGGELTVSPQVDLAHAALALFSTMRWWRSVCPGCMSWSPRDPGIVAQGSGLLDRWDEWGSLRVHGSVGWSGGLMIRWSLVRLPSVTLAEEGVQVGPPKLN